MDAALLAPQFAINNRLHISDFFNAEFATAVHKALVGDVPWTRTMVIQGQGVEAPLNTYLAAGQRRLQLKAEVALGCFPPQSRAELEIRQQHPRRPVNP